MMPGRSAFGAAIAWIAALHAAAAAPVSVAVTTAAGAPAVDAVVVLDPVDAMPPPTQSSAIIDQANKHFQPRVTVVRSGAAVTFPNSDHIRHQVYSFSPAKTFTLKLYAGTPPTAVVFDHPGLVVLGCNIHDTMVAYVAVVETPWFAKTPADGGVSLDVPPGRYRLRIWHPDAVTATAAREITVPPAGLKIPVVLDVSDAAQQPAAWPE